MRYLYVMLLLTLGVLTGCGSPVGTTGGTGTGGTGGGGVSSTPTQLILSALPTTVNSDNSSPSTITATVLDVNNAVVSGATVTFAASVGQLTAASATTDTAGQATVAFSSGASNFNQVATITATVTGVTAVQIPIQIVGTTVTLASLNTNITAATTDTLTITVKDAGNNPVATTPVTISQAGAGSVTVTPATLTTDASGVVTATIAGVTPGAVTLTVAAAGATASQVYTVTNPAAAFAITAPAVDPFALSAGTPVTVTVQAPGAVANVTFAASLGVWNGGVSSTVTVPVVAGVASASFASAQAGVSTIQVFDAANITTTDKTQIAVSQPAASATQVSLQSTVSVIAPSAGGVTNTATFTATVRDVNNQVVGGAPVGFSIANPSGGGETVSPVVVITDSFGKASTTFTSGSVSTGAGGVNVQATVLSPVGITPATSNIVIGGTAGSVAIGRASIVTVLNPTVYELPMSVLVADSNGNAVAGATVTLKAFPTSFNIGGWIDTDATSTGKLFVPCILGTYLNEDADRNLILDVGEDTAHLTLGSTCDITTMPPPLTVTGVAINYAANSSLDPPNSAAGALPQTVITDSNGVANFVLTYLKGSAAWIRTEISASTLVLGTETTSSIAFWLPYEQTEGEAGNLPDSVYGQ